LILIIDLDLDLGFDQDQDLDLNPDPDPDLDLARKEGLRGSWYRHALSEGSILLGGIENMHRNPVFDTETFPE